MVDTRAAVASAIWTCSMESTEARSPDSARRETQTRARARRSSANTPPVSPVYPFAPHVCFANCLGPGPGYEFHSSEQQTSGTVGSFSVLRPGIRGGSLIQGQVSSMVGGGILPLKGLGLDMACRMRHVDPSVTYLSLVNFEPPAITRSYNDSRDM